MTHVTCRLTAENRNQLRNPTLGNRVWVTFTFLHTVLDIRHRPRSGTAPWWVSPTRCQIRVAPYRVSRSMPPPLFASPLPSPLCADVTSSVKPEVGLHSVSRDRQRRTEPRHGQHAQTSQRSLDVYRGLLCGNMIKDRHKTQIQGFSEPYNLQRLTALRSRVVHGLGWIGSHKMDPWTTLLCCAALPRRVGYQLTVRDFACCCGWARFT